MTKIKIDRKKWLRGNKDPQGNEASVYLWNKECNAGCCLGHVIHQTNKVPYNNLHQLSSPEDFFHRTSILTNYYPEYYGDESAVANNSFAQLAMRVNDNKDYTEEHREKKLIELFLENGIILEFYN